MNAATARRVLRSPQVLVGCAAVVYTARAWSQRWISDDGFITLRVARNLASGHGPVYNPGERVEASTSTIWTVLLGAAGTLRSVVPLEWIAVFLGIGCAVGGLVLAQSGAARLHAPAGRVVVPFGALVVLALPPFADFATSGLESGLVFLWLGACFWALARAREQDDLAWWVLVLVGLGPLVRPELAVFSLGFAAVAVVTAKPFAPRAATRFVILLGAVPVGYQLFRMAYYAALFPNPVLAKESSGSRWEQGWRYVGDLGGPYRLWLPLALAGVALGVVLARALRGRDGRSVALVVAPVSCALVQGLLIVEVGGDFMHGRLLLPPLFGLLLPVMAVPIDRRLFFVVAAPVAAWALVCGLWWRVPYEGIGPDGIADERGYYVAAAGREHPVEVASYARMPTYQRGRAAREAARSGRRELLITEDRARPVALALRDDVPARVVLRTFNVGVSGYAAGTDVWVSDVLGLGDALAARIRVIEPGRPGHEKFLPADWTIARFAAEPVGVPELSILGEGVDAAGAALGCDPMPRLLDAVNERLTPRRLAVNVVRSLQFNSFRFPADPFQAESKLCGDDAG